MKMWVKQLSLFLGIILIAATFIVGCASKDSNNLDNKTVNNDVDQGNDATGDSGEKKTHKLKLLGPEGGNQYIKFAEREEYPVWQELQKLLDDAGLELEYELVPNEQYAVVVQTRMASAVDLPDIVNISPLDDMTALNLGKQGVILELNSLIEEYSNGTIMNTIEKYYPHSIGLTTAPDGNRYWFSNLHYKHYNKTEPAPVGLTILIRKDWMDALGLETPTTADEFLNVLKAFREQDANGSGQPDEVLILDPGNFQNGIAQWFGLGVDVTSVDVTNLKVVSPWYQEGIKDYFKYMQTLVKEGILDTTGLANIGETLNQKRAENKLAGCYTYGLEMWNASMTPVEDAKYMPLMPLQAVDGITPYAVMEPHTLTWDKYAITKECKDLEGAIRFFDVVHSERYIELLSWGIEGQTYYVDENGTKLFKDRVSDEQAAKERRTRGNPLYGGTVFPIIQEANLEFELVSVPDFKRDYQLEVMYYTPWYTSHNATYFAIPNDEQLEIKNKITNDIFTYSHELATKLVLGQASLEEWDSYIEKFKELGLDDLIEIDQALVDEYQRINNR